MIVEVLKRFSVSLAAAALLLVSGPLGLAQAEQLPKVGYLGFGSATPPTFFQNRMRELGYFRRQRRRSGIPFCGWASGKAPRLGPRAGQRQGGCHCGDR